MHLTEQRPLIPIDNYVCLVTVFNQLSVYVASQEASSWDVLLPEAVQDIDQEFSLRYGIEPIYRIMTYVNYVVTIHSLPTNIL